jgi:uncharacterized protein YndB with AHSA1/START domain
MGDLRLDGEGWVLRYERLLAHPPQKVWRALTESEHLRHWMPADIIGERHAGAHLTMPFWPEHVERYSIAEPVMDGEILVWDPPSVFELTWDVDRLRFELDPTPEGTRLRFTTWLRDQATPPEGAAAGYHACLDQLVALLDGEQLTSLVDVDVDELEQRYATMVRRAT